MRPMNRNYRDPNHCPHTCAGGHTCCLDHQRRHTWHICSNPACECHQSIHANRQRPGKRPATHLHGVDLLPQRARLVNPVQTGSRR